MPLTQSSTAWWGAWGGVVDVGEAVDAGLGVVSGLIGYAADDARGAGRGGDIAGLQDVE